MHYAMIMFLMLIALPAAAMEAPAEPVILIEPAEVGPGEIAVVTVQGAKGAVTGTLDEKNVYFSPSRESWKAVVGIDLNSAPGQYEIVFSLGGKSYSRVLTVVKKEYEVQRLTLPKDMVVLSPENAARVEKEQKRVSAIWPGETEKLWNGDFTNPREGKIGSRFGLRRIINKIPKSSHSGVDVSADEGAEVRAPNSGSVIFVDELFYSGISVIVDHGQGIYTMFFHLSKSLVTPGQKVARGEVIALVGSTGRSTGPHLHWGVRMQGARVDPLKLLELKLD
ncbi:MAG: hypothetical protein A2X56_15055 [Nitrospirae bacterium GWC2_57_13]|jgi:murein DD-endopeptidase MepM/ murein hydrolase activator NlpD|nr:MAG: hypothetical protein A2072_05315 [Nitrospirae bacterium GWC1_57_7]OGW28027.1 MAG: hypothetical protein A2X56_15055 [Nitrospirae bacterium GWC2_57_13]HAR44827.1 peptidase M23 [Nitrospiraceae bacterium]